MSCACAFPLSSSAYQRTEIPQSGVAATEIERKIAERNPKTVIMILDACRSLVKSEVDPSETRLIKRSPDMGSRSHHGPQAAAGVRRDVFRLVRRAGAGKPVAQRSRPQFAVHRGVPHRTDAARPIAHRACRSREADGARDRRRISGRSRSRKTSRTRRRPTTSMLIGSIGRERFRISQEKCAGDLPTGTRSRHSRKRELYERHRRRFDSCDTAELARRRLAELSLSSDRLGRIPGQMP